MIVIYVVKGLKPDLLLSNGEGIICTEVAEEFIKDVGTGDKNA